MPKYFTSKQERMYEHVKESTGSKREAAATVNKFRSKHGLTKKKKGKADDSETVAFHTAGVAGKSLKDIEGPVRAGRNMPRVAGTKERQHKRHKAHTPGSAATKLNDARKSLTIGGSVMARTARTFEDIFKSSTKSEGKLRKADVDDEESSDLEESAVAKGEGDEEMEDETSDEDSGEPEVAKGGDDEDGEEAFPCPHCASDVTVSDVKNAITKGEIHEKGVGGSPKGHQKHGEKKPARTAVTEMHGGGTSHNGKPKAGTKTPTRGVPGVSRKPNSGNVGSYAKSGGFIGSPLMSIQKSAGPAGDEAIAREIARMQGVPFEDVGLSEETVEDPTDE